MSLREGFALNEVSYKPDETLGNESYRIESAENGITVYSGDPAGKFYAEQTLKQIEYFSDGKIPCLKIDDSPRKSYRGFMMDCCRHFFTVEEIKKQIDVAAALKLNRFHWHLTDDQGWRLEIKKYPLLTEIGSVRTQTRGDGKRIEGFYSAEDAAEIVAYCKERFIEVVPEFDMPGHFTAAIAAYPHLGCTGRQIKVSEQFGIHCEIACAGKESTLEFIYGVLDEILELFPFEYIHIGGDEALKYRYLDCPDCQKAIEQNGLKDEEELQSFFLNKVIAYLNSKGRKAIVWNDGTYGGNLKGDFAVQYWKATDKGKKAVEELVNGGKEIIYSPFTSMYFDYPYGLTPLKKAYNYVEEENFSKNIIGTEATVWTEYLENIGKWEDHAYPRLFACAERAWSEKTDYKGFLTCLKNYCEYFSEKFGIVYRKKANPSFLSGLAENIAFSLKIVSVSGIKYLHLDSVTRRRMKKRRKSTRRS